MHQNFDSDEWSPDVQQDELAPNQHTETIGGTEFVFTKPVTNKIREDVKSKSNTNFQEYLNTKSEYPHDVVLHPVGDFLEAYNDDAKVLSQLLEISLISIKIDDKQIPLVGFPLSNKENFVAKLNENGINVVIMERQQGHITTILLPNIHIQHLTDRINFQLADDNFLVPTDVAFMLKAVQDKLLDDTNAKILNAAKNNTIEDFRFTLIDNFTEVTMGLYDEVRNVDEFDNINFGLDQYVQQKVSQYFLNEDMSHYSFDELKGIIDVEHIYNTLRNSKNIEATTEVLAPPVAETSIYSPPPPQFFEVYNSKDFDFSLYKSGDLLGYDADGIKHSVNFIGSTIYATKESAIGPYGEVLGADMSPEIAKDWRAWKSSLIAEQNATEVTEPEKPIDKGDNFQISNDRLGFGTDGEKIARNIAAITTLNTIEKENRVATNTEKEILSNYVGWGGLPKVFEKNNTHYTTLKELLTVEEYRNAMGSVTNAHYTQPIVIKAMYGALENLGFTHGNILEPSCGVGNFIGSMPQSMQGSNVYGVELDTITGRIAQTLYPKSSIDINGFEDTEFPDNFFDVAIGNVPFGDYQLSERKYDKHNFLIHDHFFAKSIDQIRTGGVIAFITSSGTMDKKNPKVREYMAERADFLGAIRLPDTAFKENAGTEVTSDIIFLQKREQQLNIQDLSDDEKNWIYLGKDENDITLNQYFIDNPQMIMGNMEMVSGPYGPKPACRPKEDIELSEQLSEAILHINGHITEQEFNTEMLDMSQQATGKVILIRNITVENYNNISNLKEDAYVVLDDKVYQRKGEKVQLVEYDGDTASKQGVGRFNTKLERIKKIIPIRDSVYKLLQAQVNGVSDTDLEVMQKELNNLYDNFLKTEKRTINHKTIRQAFSDDPSYYLLCSMETVDSEYNLVSKNAIFTQRVIQQAEVVTSVDNARDALVVSIQENAKVDMQYMTELYGKTEQEIFDELDGEIFINPVHLTNSNAPKYIVKNEYLSGNVREKLSTAKLAVENFPEMTELEHNVTVLEQNQPKDLEATDIEVVIGATWVKPKYIQDFVYELLNTPEYKRAAENENNRNNIEVVYTPTTNDWSITNKPLRNNHTDILATSTYGTQRVSAYEIIENALNLRETKVYDYVRENGKPKAVLNSNETAAAQEKQTVIRAKFKEWIFESYERREDLVATYNQKFNSIIGREYDGSNITFRGMNPEISLREHQITAIARIMYGDNCFLAHEVGAGKSFEMVAGVMESKRLGLCTKPLIVVPNHLTAQMGAEFLRLYPSANIMVATKDTFSTSNRKKFCGRVATNDFDCVIMGHSQFDLLNVSKERQVDTIMEEIDQVKNCLANTDSENRTSVKKLVALEKKLTKKLNDLNSKDFDDVVTFEELGVDMLVVDEAHEYKNGFIYTKMSNVAGIGSSASQKASAMAMKCRYIDEVTGGKGIVFATGTPVSNSMSELYIMQKYLQYDYLQANGIGTFDQWCTTFAEASTTFEINPQGNGYRIKTRLSNFFNLPELMTAFKEVADIKTADVLNLPTPNVEYVNVMVEPTEVQKQYVQKLSQRVEAVQQRLVDPTEDNHLKITNDGRKLGLDQRILDPTLPDDPNSKVNHCVKNIFDIWQDTAADKSTQLVFCDLSTPKGVDEGETREDKKKETENTTSISDNDAVDEVEEYVMADYEETKRKEAMFNVYGDIRSKLVEMGIPREEIAFIHDYNTAEKKQKLFKDMQEGKVRVMIGSTAKCGAGMNVQNKLKALHDLDAPWRPSDLKQRSGRIIRQGNENEDVKIFRYATKDTFDAYLWQTLEKKQKFISQIMTSKSPVRSCNDVDGDALSYAEIKMLCCGNPNIKLKMELETDIDKLKILRASFNNAKYALETKLNKDFPIMIKSAQWFTKSIAEDIENLKAYTTVADEFSPMVINDITYTDKKKASEFLNLLLKSKVYDKFTEIGEYKGMKMSVQYDKLNQTNIIQLKGISAYTVKLGLDPLGNMTRIDNLLKNLPKMQEDKQQELNKLLTQMEDAKIEVDKPFARQQELDDKESQLRVIDAELRREMNNTDTNNQEDSYTDDVLFDEDGNVIAYMGDSDELDGPDI